MSFIGNCISLFPQNLLVLFQLYVWQKKESGSWNEECPFPRDVDFMIADTIESMRPKLNLHTSLTEAHEAVEELNKEYEEKISMLCLLSVVFLLSLFC